MYKFGNILIGKNESNEATLLLSKANRHGLITGASGSGKTTLLNCISTIDKVTSGHIYLNDLDVTTLKGNKLSEFRREELGFIFQDFNLIK